MVIKDKGGSIELLMAEQLPIDSPGAGDTRFNVRVQLRNHKANFSAESSAWVDATVLANFCNQLRTLEKERQGIAELESISSGELRLEIRIFNSSGHVGAFGQVSNLNHDGVGGPHKSLITFGIPFCPTELPKLVNEFELISQPKD